MSALVVASVDAPPVLEPAEHVLDFVPLTIEFAVMSDRGFAVRLRWDAGHDPALGEGSAKPVGIIALVGEQLPGGRQRIDHQSRALVIAHLAFAKQHDDGAPLTIADGMQL